MWTMLTSWVTDMHAMLAGVHLAMLNGSLPKDAHSVDNPAPPERTLQHHPWLWCLLYRGARRARDSGEAL